MEWWVDGGGPFRKIDGPGGRHPHLGQGLDCCSKPTRKDTNAMGPRRKLQGKPGQAARQGSRKGFGGACCWDTTWAYSRLDTRSGVLFRSNPKATNTISGGSPLILTHTRISGRKPGPLQIEYPSLSILLAKQTTSLPIKQAEPYLQSTRRMPTTNQVLPHTLAERTPKPSGGGKSWELGL